MNISTTRLNREKPKGQFLSSFSTKKTLFRISKGNVSNQTCPPFAALPLKKVNVLLMVQTSDGHQLRFRWFIPIIYWLVLQSQKLTSLHAKNQWYWKLIHFLLGANGLFQGVLRIYSLSKPTSGGIPNRCCYTLSIYTYIHRINHQTVSIPPKKIQVWHQPKQYTCLSAIPSELP